MSFSDISNKSGELLDHTFHPGFRPEVLVILAHGLTGNKDRPQLVALAEGLAANGWPCLRITYAGNGASDGRFEDSCITKGIADLQAVMDVVPDTTRIAYVGHSMGGAVGVLTAARDLRIQALVSLAGMTHTADFVKREFGGVVPGKGLMWDEEEHPFSVNFADDLTHIGSTLPAAEVVSQPWLLIHGDADDLVPVQDSRDAFEAADCEKKLVIIPGAGHSFDEASYPRLVEEVDAWLEKAFDGGA